MGARQVQGALRRVATTRPNRFIATPAFLFPVLQIPKVVSHLVDSLAIRGGIAVRKEMRISVVSVLNPANVFDRTPVLLRSPCNFHDVRQHSVGVRAIHAIQPLKQIQISQFVPVDCDVALPARFRYSVYGEANGLVQGDENIGQHERNETSVIERAVRIAKNRECKT